MSSVHIDIWKRTVEAQQDIPANRFVDPFGKLGGHSGVCIRDTEAGRSAAVIVLGEAYVEIAPSQTIVEGDLVISDAQGLAVKSEDSTGLVALAVNNGYVSVLIR